MVQMDFNDKRLKVSLINSSLNSLAELEFTVFLIA